MRCTIKHSQKFKFLFQNYQGYKKYLEDLILDVLDEEEDDSLYTFTIVVLNPFSILYRSTPPSTQKQTNMEEDESMNRTTQLQSSVDGET